MEFGSSFAAPLLADLGALRADAQALDDAGFDFVTTAGHVLTARPDRYEGRPLGTFGVAFRDPFVLFSFLAAQTRKIGFRTGILILPMFPTVLVAKQAADLALLSGDRFQLGVGISWQEAEYEAFGQSLRTRGRRLEEQLEVLKLLWSNEFVTFHGEFHDIDDLGIGQLPAKPVPLWIGSTPTEALLGRVVRHGDGWLPAGGLSAAEPAQLLARLAERSGRDPSTIGIGGRIVASPEGAERWLTDAKVQVSFGATSITIAGSPELSHDDALAKVIEARQVLADDLS